MRYIKLFERFALKRPEMHQAAPRLRQVGPMNIMDGLRVMYHWFYGTMMGDKNEMQDVVDTFRLIGKVYHKPIKSGKLMYRAVKLHLPEAHMSVDDIMAITKSQVGPKQLQSWSVDRKGAEWFYNHFVHEQNHNDEPQAKSSWVIVESDVSNLDELMTFEECLKFFADVSAANVPDATQLINRLYDDEMLDLHELICLAPVECPIKVIKVLVPPISKSKMAA